MMQVQLDTKLDYRRYRVVASFQEKAAPIEFEALVILEFLDSGEWVDVTDSIADQDKRELKKIAIAFAEDRESA